MESSLSLINLIYILALLNSVCKNLTYKVSIIAFNLFHNTVYKFFNDETKIYKTCT